MKHRNAGLVCSVALGLALAALTQMGDVAQIIVPLWWLGAGLRSLSLSGAAGNLAAWALFAAITALPMVYFGVRKMRGNARGLDTLLPIAAIQIGALLYFLINPTQMPYPGGLPLADGFALIYAWGIVGTALSYALLRVLNRIHLDATSGRLLPMLLHSSGFILVGLSAYNHFALLIIRVQSVVEANTQDVTFTVVVLCVLALCTVIPAILGGMTLLWSGDVARALMAAPYADETRVLCGTVAQWCNQVAVFSIGVSLSCNLVQLLLASQLYQANITVEIPLLTLLLSSALYLLCHYIDGAKALSEDNDSII